MRRKGSYTIEAAILMPFLFFVVFTFIQVSFFLYNREAATAIASAAVLQGVQMEQEGKHVIQKSLENYLMKEIEGKLVFAEKARWDVSVTGAKVRVTVTLSQKTLFLPLECKIAKEMSRIRPASVLWEAERWGG